MNESRQKEAERVFTHNCAACMSRRVVKVERVPTPEGWTLTTATCADCGGITRYDTISSYSFIFAPLATEAGSES